MRKIDTALSASKEEQFFRRALVRTVWAYIEGCSYGLKRLTLALADENDHALGHELKVFLLGQPRPRDLPRDHPISIAWDGPVWNAVHSLAACTSLLALDRIDVLQDLEIEVMKHSAKVRDRLTHPKTAQALRVTDGELDHSAASFRAFDRAWVGVQKAMISRKR